MSGIKRYHWNGDESKNGAVVKFSDHVDEVAKCAINVEKVRGYEVAPLQAEITRLRAEADANRVDAERYRFIRNEKNHALTKWRGISLDSLVDAAIGADA